MSVCQSSDEISSASDQVIYMSQSVNPMGVAAELGQLWLSVSCSLLFFLDVQESCGEKERTKPGLMALINAFTCLMLESVPLFILVF